MKSDGNGECSISIKSKLTFTLPKNKFVNKSSAFSSCVYIPPNIVIVGAKNGNIYRWTIPDKLKDTTLYSDLEIKAHFGQIFCLLWSNSMNLLFSGSADRRVLIWNILAKSPKQFPIQELNDFDGTPKQIETYNKNLIVLDNKGVHIFQQQHVKDSTGSAFVFRRIAMIKKTGINKFHIFTNSEGDETGILFCGMEDGTIIQYDLQLNFKVQFEQRSEVRRVAAHSVNNIIYNPSTRCIFAFTYNPMIRVFNPKENNLMSLENPHNKMYVNGCCTRQGILMLLDEGCNFYIYDAQEKIMPLYETKLEIGGYGIFPANWTHDKQDMFLYFMRENVVLYEIDKGTVKESYRVHDKNVIHVKSTCSRTESLLATVGEDRLIKLWDPTDFSLRHEVKIPTRLAILSVVLDVRKLFSTDTIWAVTGHDEGKIFFIDLTNEKFVELPSKHTNSISALAVSSSQFSSMLFSCDYDGYVSAWILESIFENYSFAAISLSKIWKAHNKEILACAAQRISGSLILATGGNDKVIKLWVDEDGTQVSHELVGHTNSVTSLCFDGFFLFSGSEDFTIRVWDTFTFVQLQVISTLHTSAIRQVISIPEENKIASCDAKGSVFIYDFTKKKKVFQHNHSSDCKSIFFDSGRRVLYACIKKEIVPHRLKNEEKMKGGLPPLRSKVDISLITTSSTY